MKHYLRHDNTVNEANENKVLSSCEALRCETMKKQQNILFFFMSKLQIHYHFKLNFQKVDQHTRGKWLIHDTKGCKDNQLHSMEHDVIISAYHLFQQWVFWQITNAENSKVMKSAWYFSFRNIYIFQIPTTFTNFGRGRTAHSLLFTHTLWASTHPIARIKF